jgi:hypothetical protein
MTPKARSGILAFAIVGGLFVSSSALLGTIFLINRDRPSAAGETATHPAVGGQYAPSGLGDSWDVRDLAEHLKAHGLPRTRMYGTTQEETYFLALYGEEGWWVRDAWQAQPLSVVKVTKCSGAAGVRECLRLMSDDLLPRHWGWGRFLFEGTEESLELLKAHLR